MKRIKTIEDVIAATTLCPYLKDVPIMSSKEIGGGFSEGLLINYGKCDLGTYIDEEKGEVFHAYTVYAEADDMTFIIKEIYDTTKPGWIVKDVLDFHFGSPEEKEDEYYILKSKSLTQFYVDLG